MTPRVREILSWYGADSAGTLTNLARLLNYGRLAPDGGAEDLFWGTTPNAGQLGSA